MEKLGSRLTMFLLFALGIGFCCCATAPPVVQNPMVEIQMVSRPIRRVIAVMPFQVQAPGAYRIGEGIDDMVVTGLGESGYFQVVERKNLDRIMSEQGLQVTDLINESTAVRLGNLVGAKYILLGSLTQYSPIYQADFSTFSKSYYQKVEISLDARIVDVETGMVASSARGRGQWEKTRSKWEKSTIYDREPGAGDVEPDVINSSLRNAVNDLVNNLTRAFAR